MKLQEWLSELENKESAVLAANFYNFETLSGILQAAEETGSEIILQTSPATIEYLGVNMAVSMAKAALKKYNVQGWLHLDHAESINLIKTCLDAGYDSVMIDASDKSFPENVTITSQVVELAKTYDASVEAELGYVAKLGQSQESIGFTDPYEAKVFHEKTGIHSLAVAIGSAHGFYKEEPKLDLDRLERIHRITDCALVLHGSSGVPDDQLQAGIKKGIRKINLATEIKDTFMKSLQRQLHNSNDIDLRKVFPPATDAVKQLVARKINLIKAA
ncbi:MAG: class II fructose-bisphosphate aldolase [Balneolaceae bacterium]|nr:class II fructose-bisphosphate aldolase [Balneolaceae bacterium]